MSQFDKVAVFTDIHFGKKSDSEQHNRDCLEYVEWFCTQVQENQCDTVIFMGDWFDNRSRLRVDTIDYSWKAIQMLDGLGMPVHWLIGNHDLFFKTHRGIHSLPYLNSGTLKNINVINEITELDDVILCPWLVGNEFSSVPTYEVKYVFGHFELPLFLLNEMVEMPDRGGLHMNHFTECEAVFSGHFHKRQLKVNEHGIPVWYIGNCFPHDFNDAGDTNRGCMILEWGQDPEFLNWEGGPSFHRVTLTNLLDMVDKDTLESTFGNRAIVECRDDIGIEIEQATELNELLTGNLRELRLRPKRDDLDVDAETDIPDGEQSVDQLVIEHLRMLDTEGSNYDPEVLVELYQNVGT